MRFIFIIFVFILASILQASNISPQKLKKLNNQAKTIEQKKQKLPYYKKKLDSYVLKKVDKIQQALKKGEIVDVAQIKSKFSDDIIKINKKGELRLRILLPEDMSYHEFEQYQDWLKNKNITIIFAYYPSPEIENSRPKISCYIPFEKIMEIAKDRRTIAIRPILKPRTHVGLETTEGDTQLYAKLAREQKNVDGTGIKVGVISDGIQGYTESQSSGDLGMVSILPGHEKEGMEGRAMMEIIYDLAPNCELIFGSSEYGDGTYEQMITTINNLIDYGCKIIVDDIGFYNEPMFKDSELAQHITNKINTNHIIYISAAGNDAKSMYTGEINTTADDWIIFYTENYSTYIQNMVTVDTGRTIKAILQWADDWEHPDTDLDLYLVDVNGDTIGDGGKTIQNPDTTNPPLEICSYKNDTGMPKDIYIMIKYVNGDYSARKFKLLAAKDFDLQFTHENGKESEYQIYGHAAAEGAISVAAYPAQDTLHLEDFSSFGPTVLYESTSGYSYRNTPTITATDGVRTSLYETPFETFYGTSAAAPHIAGIAALFLNYYGYNSNSPEDFFNALTQNADGIDGGTGGVWNKHSGYGKANAYETLGGGPLKIWVDQLGSNGLTLSRDSIYHWESSWIGYETPFQFEWEKGTNQLLKADTNIFNDEKFKYWKKDSTIIIKKNFTIDKNTDRIDAQFSKVYQVKVKASLTAGGTDSVQFKDPWLRDSLVNPYGMQNRGNEAIFHQYDSTLVLSLDSKHQGVFLDQGYDPVNNVWTPPYYEVKADAQQTFSAHGQNITGYFLNWEGTQVDFEHPDQQETAVVFKAENAEARAVYKGHLASSLARATGYNNGRRLCKTNDGKLHLVYEDDKSIWYTYSENNGASWQKEICIARKDLNGNFFFIAPSITHFDNKVYVTYIEIYDNGGYGDILINGIDYDDVNPQWSSEYWVGSIWHDDTLAVTSVVVSKTDDASGQIIPIIAVGYNFDGTNTIDIYQKELQSSYYDLVTSFEGKFPSLSADTYHSIQNEQLAIAYSFANQIFVKTAWWNSGFLTWSGYEKISEDDENYPIQTQPSLSMMNGYCHVAWLAFNDNTQKFEIFYRMYMPGTGNTISSAAPPGSLVPYGTITKIISTNYDVLDPTISALEDQTAYIFYHKNNWIYKRKFVNQVNKNNWYYGEGNFPSMADHYDEGTAWKYYDTSPFLIHTDANGPSNAIPITPVNPNWGSINKVLSADQNGGSVGRITINFFDFTYGVDTLSFNQTLRTDNLAVNGNLVKFSMDLQVIFNNVQNLPPDEEALYYAYFVDQNDTIFLSKLTYGDLPKNAGPDGERFFKVNTIVDLGNRNGHFYIDLADTTFIVYRNLIENEENTIGKFKIERQILPESFALNQNFPNPFNPVTHITVDLPQDAKVELSVFDINGKKVQTLLTGQKPAGIYEVIFDGKHLASGVYIYRLTTDKGFVQSRKMMLIK